MDTVSSSVKFHGYRVKEAIFRGIDVNIPENEEFEINPRFTRKINCNNEIWTLELGVQIDSENNLNLEHALPFSAQVTIEGAFEIEGYSEEDKEKVMKINAVAIMFPYLRSTLSMLMALMNMNPVVLPTINLVKTFEKEQDDAREASDK